MRTEVEDTSDKNVPSITSREKHLNRNSDVLSVYAPTSSYAVPICISAGRQAGAQCERQGERRRIIYCPVTGTRDIGRPLFTVSVRTTHVVISPSEHAFRRRSLVYNLASAGDRTVGHKSRS